MANQIKVTVKSWNGIIDPESVRESYTFDYPYWMTAPTMPSRSFIAQKIAANTGNLVGDFSVELV